MVELEKKQNGEKLENIAIKKTTENGSTEGVQPTQTDSKDFAECTSFSSSVQFQKKVEMAFASLQNLKCAEEKTSYILNVPNIGKDDNIGLAERDSAVTTIKAMHRFYNYNPETLAAAVSYLDRFISKVKVKKRYMSCVAAAAFFLAAKMNEESEFYPCASDLASINRYSWKPSDLKRMEKLILDKLEWNMFPATSCLAFIEKFYEILKLFNVAHPEVDTELFDTMVERSEIFMNFTRCAGYNPCTLALAITTQCLKEIKMYSAMNKFLLLHIQTTCQIPDAELFDCTCTITNQLDLYCCSPEVQPKCLPMPKIIPRPTLVKRPSFYGSPDLPTIEEVSLHTELQEAGAVLETEPVVENSLTLVPSYLTPTSKFSKSYCLLVDQCYFSDQKYYFCESKCNITIA